MSKTSFKTILGLPVKLVTRHENEEYYKITDPRLADLPAIKVLAYLGTIRNDITEPFKLDPTLKTEWVRRLRSGHYTQGTGFLKRKRDNGIRHCCLGILCEIMELSERMMHLADHSETVEFSTVDGDASSSEVPSDAWPGPPEIQDILSAMNDGKWTFAQIADFIEVAM
jgi:hypothetical protein